MELRKSLSHLKPDDCLEAECFRAWIKGEISQDEWMTAIAVSEGGRCLSTTPRVYAPLSQSLRVYCEGRIEDRLQYDFETAKRLGAWFIGIRTALEFNLERLEHYTWSAARTERIQAGDAYQNLCRARDRFTSMKFPEDDFRFCMHVKKMDADARSRNSRSA